MLLSIPSSSIIFDAEIQRLCKLPYPDHPRGCPNFGRKFSCPPSVPLIDKVLDLSRPEAKVICTPYNIGAFTQRMKARHPEWTERQCHNCRLWQPTARKAHREEVRKYMREKNFKTFVGSPEANGVDICNLMTRLGIRLQWPPRKTTWIVSLAQ